MFRAVTGAVAAAETQKYPEVCLQFNKNQIDQGLNSGC